MRPLWTTESGPESAPDEPPKIRHFFFVATRSRTFLGAAAEQPTRAGELIPVLRKPVFREPGTFGFITQPSIFGRGIGGGRSVNLDISGPDLERVLARLLASDELRDQLGSAGRRRAVSHPWDRVHDRATAALERLAFRSR